MDGRLQVCVRSEVSWRGSLAENSSSIKSAKGH